MYEISLTSATQVLLSCEFGKITVNPQKTKFGFVAEKMSLERLHFSIEDDCTNYLQLIYSLQPCIGKNKCKVHLSKNWIKLDNPDCKRKLEGGGLKTVLALHCKNVLVSIRGKEGRSIIKLYINNFGLCAAVAIFSFYYLIS